MCWFVTCASVRLGALDLVWRFLRAIDLVAEMKTLDNDAFLTELAAMYGRHQARTVFVSMKRHFVERADHPGSVEPVCLVRAVANDEKISTIVSAHVPLCYESLC